MASLAGVLRHQDRDPAPNLSQSGLWRTLGKKNTVTRPMSTGEEVLYGVCVLQARRKKHDPWPPEFEMNMAAWATRLIPFGMQEGYIHHAEEQMCRCGTGVHGYGWSPLGGPSQFKRGF